MPPALSRKGCFLKGGGTFCQREKVPLPSSSLPLPARFIRANFSANDGTLPHRCKHAVIRRPGTCRYPVRLRCCTWADIPSSGMVPSGTDQARQDLLRHAWCGIPACLRIPYRPSFTARPLPSPRPFSLRSLKQPLGLLPLCGNVPEPPFVHKGCRRRPQAPAQKKRNFLDLWQTIAQDLSRLFAVPGGCPSCPGSRKDWPEPLSRFRRPVPAPSLLPAAFRKALCAAWPEHDAHADTDMTTRQGRTPFHRAAPPQHRGTGAGWLPEALRHSRMDLNKKFWQG